MTELTVVIPVHNRRELTQACLAALVRQTHPRFDIVVVDDGSTDGTGEMIRSLFPATTVLRGDGNLWWAGATNRGVQHALERGAARVLLLNDDTEPEPDFVEKMMWWSERRPGAILGALALDIRTGEPFFGGERISWWTASYHPVLAETAAADRHGLREVTHAPGRGLLIPAAIFDRLGLFDAVHFPQAAADYDFTHRARRFGFDVYCNYDARLKIHTETGGGDWLQRNRSWRHYGMHLFGRKGAGNLKVFLWYAWRNCPRIQLPLFFLCGLARRVLGYPLHWMAEQAGLREHAR